VDQQLFHHTFPNGLTLLAERMPHVRSATMYFSIPAGFTYEPSDRLGIAGILAEMITRGAGHRDSRELSLALDNLGADRGETPGAFNITLSAGTLGRKLPQLLEHYADIVLRPHLPADQLEAARELAMQDLQGLEDSPSDLCLIELKNRHYPPPYNRTHYGTPGGIAAITPESLRDYYECRFRPDGAVISVAGNVEWEPLKAQVGELFRDWKGTPDAQAPLPPHTATSTHITKDTNQTQIALAFPSAAFGTPDFYPARGAISVLSGGMGARLFTEVREKRGLCYSVSASYDNVRERAAVLCYAGTRADRAQQTLDVTVGELRRLKDGIEDEEVQRVKAGLKTSLIMQQESTSARAGSMAVDWFYLKRLRPISEIQDAIDALSAKAILGYLDRYPAKDFTVVTLGPEPLTLPE
jgi:predicted Zn-dependent peptidase